MRPVGGRGTAVRAPGPARLLRALAFAALSLIAAACAPTVQAPGPAAAEPRFEQNTFVARDGAALPVRAWTPKDGKPRAAIVALHGFNDYGHFFEGPGAYLAGHGIVSYAYDQRGFGKAPHWGLWPGVDALTGDLRTFVGLVRRRHPGTPVFALGESMGGAVALVAMTGPKPPQVDGVILAAPAVWGRATMPFYQRWALWLGAHTVPWMKLSGRSLRLKASDNVEMLRALGRDPLVIKKSRIDTIYGLVNLMDAALDAAPAFTSRALILYGLKDEIIPRAPAFRALRGLPKGPGGGPANGQRVALYDGGYHMLLRDLGAEVFWRDIAAWIADPAQRLPSKADARAKALLAADGGG